MDRRRSFATLLALLLMMPACAGSTLGQVESQEAGDCATTVIAGETLLADAAAAASPGDIVCLSGVFSERLLIPAGGTEAAPVVFRSLDPDAPAVLSPPGEVPAGDQGVIELRDVSHVRVEGIDITGWSSGVLAHAPAGIVVASSGTNAVSGVHLVGNHVHDMGHTHEAAFSEEELADCEGPVAECAADLAFSIQSFGIVVKGRATQPIRDLRVIGNELNDLTLGGSEALVINGNVESFEITDNLVHDINNIAIDAIGFEDLDTYPAATPAEDRLAREGLIARNRVWNSSSDGNPAYGRYGPDGTATEFDKSAVGIYIDGGRDIIIEGNVVVGADIGIEVAAEYDLGVTRDNVVRNNIVARTVFAGISVGGYAEETSDDGVQPEEFYNGEGDAVGIQVVHNTVHTSGGGAALFVQYRVADSVIAGNVLVGPEGQIVESVEKDALAGVDRSGNLELVAAAEGENPDGVFGNAGLPGPADLRAGGDALRPFLHLAAGSAALDAGVTVTPEGSLLNVGPLDVDGDPRRAGSIDLGADEVGGDEPPQTVESVRIAGSNRFATATAIASQDHPDGADVVVVARADDFADALASAPVAFAEDAPVLLSETSSLNAETAAAIETLDPALVILFGGPAALDDAVERALSADRGTLRIAGPNRYATAVAAAGRLTANGCTGADNEGARVAIVAEAGDPLGPLAAGVPAAVGCLPVLLADADRLPGETQQALGDLDIDVVELIGNRDQLSAGVQTAIEALGITVHRVEGATPLDTVVAVAEMGARRGLLDGAGVVLGRGDLVVDTLTAGPHAAARRVPILLTTGPTVLGAPARGWLGGTASARGLIEAVGGVAALTPEVLQDAVDTASRN